MDFHGRPTLDRLIKGSRLRDIRHYFMLITAFISLESPSKKIVFGRSGA